MDAISLGNPWLYTMNIIYCVIYSAILLVLSTLVLERKGVRG